MFIEQTSSDLLRKARSVKTLAHMARKWRNRCRLRISSLLPYCDAMFIDKECWTYFNEEPLRSELKFGTKLFSLKNKKEFLDYLDAIRASATPEHLTMVQELYGDGCLTPYTSIYRKENI